MAGWDDDVRQLVESVPVARLATLNADGTPHLVPITFAVVAGGEAARTPGEVPVRLVTAVDHKPKRTRALRRLANLERDRRVSVLVDHYDDDWRRLWWVRLDGEAVAIDSGRLLDAAIDALVARYPQYRDRRPAGPVISVTPLAVRCWRSDRDPSDTGPGRLGG